MKLLNRKSALDTKIESLNIWAHAVRKAKADAKRTRRADRHHPTRHGARR